jgi:phospholipid transport system transporter-binding protein
VRAADSASVAVLLSWRRRAAAEGTALSFVDVPPNLVALAELYGVEDLLKP